MTSPLRVLPSPAPASPRGAGAVELPSPPGWLSAYAKAEWCRVAPILARLGTLDGEADTGALVGYAQAHAELRLATEELDREGRSLTVPSGYRQPHPAVARANKAQAALLRWSSELGLTPRARTKLPRVERPTDETKEEADYLTQKMETGWS